MCWRWLDIFLIKIYVLNSYQVTKLAKYKEGGFSWVWAKHLQINLLGSLDTGESQHPFDLKAGWGLQIFLKSIFSFTAITWRWKIQCYFFTLSYL